MCMCVCVFVFLLKPALENVPGPSKIDMGHDIITKPGILGLVSRPVVYSRISLM